MTEMDPLAVERVTCATCGAVLDGDPDEEFDGDAGLPLCGGCRRSNDFVVLDLIDGDLDGQID